MSKTNVKNTEVQTTLIETCKTLIDGEIQFLGSDANLNKNANRKLIRLDDDRFNNTMRMVKFQISLAKLEEEEAKTITYDMTKYFIGCLRSSELVVQSTKAVSQTRHALNVLFNEFVVEAVKRGLAFPKPTNPKLIVWEELHVGSGAKKGETLKPSYLKLDLNCGFDSFVSDVVEVERIVKS